MLSRILIEVPNSTSTSSITPSRYYRVSVSGNTESSGAATFLPFFASTLDEAQKFETGRRGELDYGLWRAPSTVNIRWSQGHMAQLSPCHINLTQPCGELPSGDGCMQRRSGTSREYAATLDGDRARLVQIVIL
jgi:hypothetical protein